MNQGGMLKPALIGGVLLGILSAIPPVNLLNCFCCAWVIGGGILAAHLCIKSSPEAVTLGRGLGLGLLTGVIGAFVYILFSIPLQMLTGALGVNVVQQMERMLDQFPDIPPEAKDRLRSLFENPGTAGVFLMLVASLFTFVLFSFMGMIGGAIGVALFEKRKPGQTRPEAPPATTYGPSDFPPPPPPPPLQ